MTMRRVALPWLTAVMICLLMGGCASTRLASDLKISGDTGLELGQARFCIVGYEDAHAKEVSPAMEKYRLTARQLQERAKVLYPRLFSDDWTALPITVRDKIKNDESGMTRAGVGSGLTLGIIPFAGTIVTSHEVSTIIRDAFGENLVKTDVRFETELGTWVTIFSPLGSLPVPGDADLPRDTVLLGIPLSGDPYGTGEKYVTYGADLMIEAIVKSLRSIEIASLEAAYRRQPRPQELAIDGQTYWCLLAPVISHGSGQPVSFAAMLYQEKPERGAKPHAQAIVAQRGENGGWVPVNGYLRNTRKLTAVSTLLEGGAPVRVVARAIEEPPLQDFIDLPDLSAPDLMDHLRWSNGILLEAKNRSLENLLRLESRDTLLELATRIERSILDLSEQSERAKDRAQRMVEKGEGDPEPERELAVLCRQRIEVLKPILAALKQAAALRRQQS